jgi:23S rRNA pseudouridine1911/1915/1917 synthase
MVVTPEGREACTFYQVVRYFREYTLVEATLKTGRTHQIRVHLSTIGHPVIGDAVYGIKSPFLKRQFIHSHCLGFVLPSSDEYVEFHSELPPDLQQALERAERERMAQEECTTRSPILM